MNETENAIPQAKEMELELLGSLLIRKGEIIPKVAAIISPDDFYLAVHREVYQIILDLHKSGTIPTILSIYNKAEKHPDFKDNKKIFTEVITSLGEVAFTNAYAEDDARTIKEKSIRRQLIQFAKVFQKDLNDAQKETTDLLSSAEKIFRSFNDTAAPAKLITPNFYFSERLDSDIEKTKAFAKRKTGFSNIDEYQIFSPGLYIIGATPAAGKTTFCWQLLEQLAENGENVIFCSYEMSALELYSKTLARNLFLRDRNSKLTAADIRRGSLSATLQTLKQELKNDKNLKGVNLFELREENVDDLLRLIRPHCTGKEKSPVVCIDYLQIVPSSDNKRLTTDKMKIDDIVHKLKTFQRETNTTFIVVSSFNRTNYAQQVSFESFKESGGIEYSADVIWAMQLNAVNELTGGESVSQVREHFENAKKQQPREIQLKCLKNRQGQNYDCFFNYYSAHDLFEVLEPITFNFENPLSDDKPSKKKKNSGKK